jgi:predicted porin
MFTKKIVAGAALLALAAAAQAQVKVYGSLDLSVGSYKAAGGKSTTQVSSGNMMTSFIGFSGSEDLGGGLKAEFALESFIAPDTGSASSVYNMAGGFWGRGSFVALTGGFGKVALGQYDNALFTYGYTYNPFGSSMMFSPTMRHYYALGLGNANSGNALAFDTGWVNSITYESPVFAGFQATAQFSPKESGTSNSSTVGVSYNAGPLSAALAYTDAGNGSPASAYLAEQQIVALGASYDFGVVKAFGQYTKVDNGDNGAADEDLYQVGVSIPVTEKGTVLASWGQDKVKNNGGKDTIFSLGYDHYISKRTDVYAVISNEKATGLKSGNTFAVGIKHAF